MAMPRAGEPATVRDVERAVRADLRALLAARGVRIRELLAA